MKRLSKRDFLLFALPFLILAVVVLHSNHTLKLNNDKRLFEQEIANKIPVGMQWSESSELLEENGFSNGFGHSTLEDIESLGYPEPIKVHFFRSQMAFPSLYDRHTWKVVIWVRDGQVQKVRGSYIYAVG